MNENIMLTAVLRFIILPHYYTYQLLLSVQF